jgi:tRNA(Ile)-lysidine synthase
MAPVRDGFRRPFLDLPRTITAKACADLGLAVWHDPHNDDPRYLRSVVRHRSLPRLESDLGPGVAAALARTAARLRADADALDGWADTVLAGTDPLSVRALAELPSAVRTRVIRRAVVAAGVSASALSAGHVAALDRLVNDWRGQGAVALPGGFVGRRAYGRLRVDGPDGSRPS